MLFRSDLLDRLAFDVLTLPPLRARTGDVALLADHFARAMAADLGWKVFPGFAESARASLEAYAWPGNVRELKNVVERAVAWSATDTTIDAIVFDPFESPFRPRTPGRNDEAAAAPPIRASTAPPPVGALPSDFKAAVASFESELLTRALTEARHNQRVAAKRLGLGYHQFRNTLRKHGLLPPRTPAP